MPDKYDKKDASRFLMTCRDFNIKTSLLLNYGNYDYEHIAKEIETFYLPLGPSAVVVSDLNLIRYIKKNYPQLEIYGSCISYHDTIEGLQAESSAGVTLHNPAVWTIRDFQLVQSIHKAGLKQKHIFSEGCARKCPLEIWHRKEISKGHKYDLNSICKKSMKSLEDFLLGSWVTMRQVKRMEKYIDVLKIPRDTFNGPGDLEKFIEIYDNDIPYNILEYISTPLAEICKGVKIMSDIFDDEFFDKTADGKSDKNFLAEYIKKIGKISIFEN